MKLELTQLNKEFIKSSFVGKVKFSDLKSIATITVRKINDDGDDNNLFQRPSDSVRISEISKFLSEKLLDANGKLKTKDKNIVVFPTAVIISLNQRDDDTEPFINWDDRYLEFDEGMYEAFIVDGQHRFLGIQRFYEENKLSENDIDIELPVTVLVGYDIWEQSKIFYEVNFKQKQVNKSLYYDLFGSMPGEPSKEKLAHSLVKYLNYNQESPFFEMVKMLGVGPGIISQAFLVEKLVKLFAPKKALSFFYDYYENGESDQNLLAKTLLVYFESIKKQFPEYYPKKNKDGKYSSTDQDVLFKTTGVGAFFRLLNDFENEINSSEASIDSLKEIFNSKFSLVSKDEAIDLFSKNGQFGGGSSEGTQVRLYNRLRDIINYKDGVIGKTYENAKVTDLLLIDLNGKKMHKLTMNDGTTKIIGDAELLSIKDL